MHISQHTQLIILPHNGGHGQWTRCVLEGGTGKDCITPSSPFHYQKKRDEGLPYNSFLLYVLRLQELSGIHPHDSPPRRRIYGITRPIGMILHLTGKIFLPWNITTLIEWKQLHHGKVVCKPCSSYSSGYWKLLVFLKAAWMGYTSSQLTVKSAIILGYISQCEHFSFFLLFYTSSDRFYMQ